MKIEEEQTRLSSNEGLQVSVVVPVFNEEGNIKPLAERLQAVLQDYHPYEVIFVDDGSSDGSLETLKQLYSQDKRFKYLSFSRNFGHQNALKAGLDHAFGACVISMDADLEQPPEVIPELINKWKEGNEIVHTSRRYHLKLGFFKKFSAKSFYKIMNFLCDFPPEERSCDFRLLDQKVVEVFRQMTENPLFFRGMVKWVGFKQTTVSYLPAPRFWGKSKYTMSKMFNFAFTGITSFSIKPLHLSTFLGFFFAFSSFCYGCYALYIKLFTDKTIDGWASLLLAVVFLGGIQLVMIGILGEYLGKLFIEAKRRPSYLIKEKSN